MLKVVVKVPESWLLALWNWFTCGYSLACIAEMLTIWGWHHFHLGEIGIPTFLYRFATIPMWGIVAVPLFLFVELILVSTPKRRARIGFTFRLALFGVVIWCCLLGYG